jgi:hypothetical protein
MNDASGHERLTRAPPPNGADDARTIAQDENDIDREERDLERRIVEAPTPETPSRNENGSSKTSSPTRR